MLEETEVSQEKIVQEFVKKLNSVESNRERNELIAGALASFQMQTLAMGMYLSYVHTWIMANLATPGMKTFFDPDEFVAFQSMPPDEFRDWFGKKRELERADELKSAKRIITLG